MTEPGPEGCRLDPIATDWTILYHPPSCRLRYAAAIRSYGKPGGSPITIFERGTNHPGTRKNPNYG
jgi:hypothetical protein